MFSPADIVTIPFGDWVNEFVRGFLVPNFRGFFQTIEVPVEFVMEWLNSFFNWVPMVVFTLVMALIAWRTAGKANAIFAIIALAFVDMIQLWGDTMTTLAMVLTAVVFCAIVGVPVGILAAGSDRFLKVIRPILDIMQTIPSFVYLVPIVMLFGVGSVPGVIATIIFALPPIIRLTNLGIRQVPEDLVEAAESFGSTRWQKLIDVQLPLAMRTIMAGLNQTLMLALSMSVIAALIGAGGLGLVVNTGLGRLDVGRATAGGVGIVIIAIILDRITQGLAERKQVHTTSLWQTLRGFFQSSSSSAKEKQLAEKAG
ncbi:ABC transporter permease [Pararhizobium mangrovi]|uniref:Proline/glycine betaine ABC transporter permease n=1 Tax=Pararhizobium mangrovi TaxID=2590452 RepID=A0A506U620_9HYPH|nr:proline/glycine betaine ABC transporter permease [Pararhizobium mangrovi]TPW29300.1 proline/glycine betaine ABC transporter permease [Pararhizobium mangrovi]